MNERKKETIYHSSNAQNCVIFSQPPKPFCNNRNFKTTRNPHDLREQKDEILCPWRFCLIWHAKKRTHCKWRRIRRIRWKNLSIMQHLNRWTAHYQWTNHLQFLILTYSKEREGCVHLCHLPWQNISWMYPKLPPKATLSQPH